MSSDILLNSHEKFNSVTLYNTCIAYTEYRIPKLYQYRLCISTVSHCITAYNKFKYARDCGLEEYENTTSW